MNKQQFDFIAKKLIRSPQQREAVEKVVIDTSTAYEAEKAVYGTTTKTVGRDVKRVNDFLADANEVVQLAFSMDQFERPPLNVKCIVWLCGEPAIDWLTDEDHHEPYWSESIYAYGDEDKFIILPE